MTSTKEIEGNKFVQEEQSKPRPCSPLPKPNRFSPSSSSSSSTVVQMITDVKLKSENKSGPNGLLTQPRSPDQKESRSTDTRVTDNDQDKRKDVSVLSDAWLAHAASAVHSSTSSGDSWKPTLRPSEEATLTWAGRLLQGVRQIEVAMKRGDEAKVCNLVEASVRDGITLPPHVLKDVSVTNRLKSETADTHVAHTLIEGTSHRHVNVIRIGIDLHNVLDAQNKFRASEECIDAFARLHKLGCMCTVVSYIGEQSHTLIARAKEFIRASNHAIANRYPNLGKQFLGFKHILSRCGLNGKAQWLKDNGYSYHIDDNKKICVECAKNFIKVLKIRTKHESHSSLIPVFSTLAEALNTVVNEVSKQRQSEGLIVNSIGCSRCHEEANSVGNATSMCGHSRDQDCSVHCDDASQQNKGNFDDQKRDQSFSKVKVGAMMALASSAFTPPASSGEGHSSSPNTSLMLSSSSNEPSATQAAGMSATVNSPNLHVADSSDEGSEAIRSFEGARRNPRVPRSSSGDSRRSSPYAVQHNTAVQQRTYSPSVDVDVTMFNQEVSNTSMVQNNMQQNNLQVSNQLNAHVTNVYTDEAQQLLTLQVTAAAAAAVAETQMQAQLQLTAADNVVQQQQMQIAQLTQAAQNAQTQAQQFALERAQWEGLVTERVRQLEHELAVAKQSLFNGKAQGYQQSTSVPQGKTSGLPATNQGPADTHVTAFKTPPAVQTTSVHSPGDVASSSAQPVNSNMQHANTVPPNSGAQVPASAVSDAAAQVAVQNQLLQNLANAVQAISLRLGHLEAKAIQPPPAQPALMQPTKASNGVKAKGVAKTPQVQSNTHVPEQIPKMARKAPPVPPFPGTVVWGAKPPPPPPTQVFSDHESIDPPDSDLLDGSDEDWEQEGEEGEEEEELEYDPLYIPPPPLCSLCGGAHDEISCPSRRSPLADSLAGSTSSQKLRKESTVVRVKDLDNFRISTLPKDAAAFRGWRNAFIAKICRYDCSNDSYLNGWIMKAFTLRGKEAEKLKDESDICPRLDKIIASELVDPKHLSSSNEIGLEFQAYIEQCTMNSRPARGRYMINMLAKTFDLDKHRGALLTQLQVLQIPLEGFGTSQLTTFRQKVIYALNAVPEADRPDDRLLGEWLYQRLKGCKRLEHELRLIKNSSPKSKRRLFPWLWRRLKDSLLESKEDSNAAAVDGALKSGPPHAAKAAGAVAKTRAPKVKRGKQPPPQQQPGSSTKPPAPSNTDGLAAPPKTKGKPPRTKGPDTRTPEEKARTPCIFFHKYGSCKAGSDCVYSHTQAPPPKKQGGKGPPAKNKPPAKTSGGVALIAGLASLPITAGANAAEATQNIEDSDTHVTDGVNLKRKAMQIPFFRSHIALSTTTMNGDLDTRVTSPKSLIKPAIQTGRLVTTDGDSDTHVTGPKSSFTSAFNSICAAVNAVTKTLKVPKVVKFAATASALVNKHLNQQQTFEVEWVDDSGAGRHLGSAKDLIRQGIPEQLVKEFSQRTSSPVEFSTGGGDHGSKHTIGFHSDTWGSSNTYLLKSCPLVRSQGLNVNGLNRPYIWLPGHLPFYVLDLSKLTIKCDEDNKLYAHRVQENVPYFKETVTFTHGLVSTLSPEELNQPAEEENLQGDVGPAVAHAANGDIVDLAPRLERIQAEALSSKHLISHFPKNPLCEVCQRARMYSMRIRKKQRSAPEEADLSDVTRFGQRFAADHVIVAKSSADSDKLGASGERVVLCIRDVYSGAFSAYPLPTKHTDSSVNCYKHFAGTRAQKDPTVIVKSDCAPELFSAANHIGWFTDPSLENRFPHNAVMERDIRTFEEITRAVHLASGFTMFPELWPVSCKYASAAYTLTALPPILAHERDTDAAVAKLKQTRYSAATGEKFPGPMLALGQLVHYRKLSSDKFTANAVPGIFAGWRFESGLTYRKVVLVLDYQSLQQKSGGYFNTISVPEPELYIPEGEPIFPLRAAAEEAMNKFADASLEDRSIQPLMLPFTADASFEKRPRRMYITWKKILEIGPTPDCRGCSADSRYHKKECVERFIAHYGEEEPATNAADLPGPPDISASSSSSALISSTNHKENPCQVKGCCKRRLDDGTNFQSQSSNSLDAHATRSSSSNQSFCNQCFERHFACVCGATSSLCVGLQESQAAHAASDGTDKVENRHIQTKGRKSRNRSTQKGEDLTKPLQGISAAIAAIDDVLKDAIGFLDQTEADALNIASREHYNKSVKGLAASRDTSMFTPAPRHNSKLPCYNWLLEFCCDQNSMMGKIGDEIGINIVRLHEGFADLRDHNAIEQLKEFVRLHPGVSIWGSLPCTPWSMWQFMAVKRHGTPYLHKLHKRREESLALVANFIDLAREVRKHGGHVSFEWPKNATGWMRSELISMIAEFDMYEATFDGCRFNLTDPNGEPIKKPWRVVSTCPVLSEELNKYKCSHGSSFKHSLAEGSKTKNTAFYPEAMCRTILNTLFREHVHKSIPMMSVVPNTLKDTRVTSDVVPVAAHAAAVKQEHRQRETPVTDFADIPSRTPVGFLLPGSALGAISICSPDAVPAHVTKLLSRKEMLADPKAIGAIQNEAGGLIQAGTWDLSSVRSKQSIIEECKANSTSAHFGQLMTICSIKHHELPESQQKHKGRIVYRGDVTKDHTGALAVFQELSANPTSLISARCNLAYGCLPGHTVSQADAIQAYIQSYLITQDRKGRSVETWISLPPELQPKEWRSLHFRDPVVKLVKALYGHPDSGGLWERHLRAALVTCGFTELTEHLSSFWHPKHKCLLTAYVDDILLSGPMEAHEKVWQDLRDPHKGNIRLEDPVVLSRFLGCNHHHSTKDNQQTIAFEMAEYIDQAIEKYEALSGARPLRKVSTPFLPEGSLPQCDDEVRGELASDACGVLMKNLYAARLSRPDLLKPINELAKSVTKWTRNHDRQLWRLMCYMKTTRNYQLEGVVGDKPEEIRLELFVDSDFAGETKDAKSTSGAWLRLAGAHTSFPLMWSSKRQTSVSRSTTEAEVIAMASAVFGEAIPVLQLWETVLQRPVDLIIHEDNQATILVVERGYSSKLRHITRTHKVNLGSLSELLLDKGIKVQYVESAKQAADIFTKALEPLKWPNAIELLNIKASANPN